MTEMKKFFAKALIPVLSICLLCTYGTAGAVAADTIDIESAVELDATAGIVAACDPVDYVNNEVLVSYTDGTFQVLTYEDDNALAAGLEALAADKNVNLVQPNYSYSGSVFSTRDTLTSQQWALSNDGSFYMEEKKNKYPVYNDPFGSPSGPRGWTLPQEWKTSGHGQSSAGGEKSGSLQSQSSEAASFSEQVRAVKGIDINAERAWKVYNGGSRDVVIALIDTGVDNNHEDLSNAIWVNKDEIPGNGIDDDGNGYVDDVHGWNFYRNNNRIYAGGSDDSHGTHGAGTIAATADNGVGIAGIVQSGHVKIMVLKALGGFDGRGSTASIIRAIQYAEANGASICNLSLGSYVNDRALHQVMADSNMLFVVAAGNNGADTDRTPVYPASYPLDNIISVANLNCNGTLHSSSNYGRSSVDLAAPGSYILSTTPKNSYSYMTGTSMSAPMVTAAAAMVYSHYKNITLADVKEILLTSVRKLDSLKGVTATGGMLDLGAAMNYNLSMLSGKTWNHSASVTAKNAPEILTTVTTRMGKTYLVVKVTDADGDLMTTAYAAGKLTAKQFQGGKNGKIFTVGADGTAAFLVSTSGTYTFYAADKAGNETVKTVSVTCSTQGSSTQNGKVRRGSVPPFPRRQNTVA